MKTKFILLLLLGLCTQLLVAQEKSQVNAPDATTRALSVINNPDDQFIGAADGDAWVQCEAHVCFSTGVAVRIYVPSDAGTTGTSQHKVVAQSINKRYYATASQLLITFGTTAPNPTTGVTVENLGYVGATSSYCDKKGFPIKNQNVYEVSQAHTTNYNGNSNTLHDASACFNYPNFASLANYYNSQNGSYLDIPVSCSGCIEEGENPNDDDDGPGAGTSLDAANQELDDITLDPLDGDGGINPGGGFGTGVSLDGILTPAVDGSDGDGSIGVGIDFDIIKKLGEDVDVIGGAGFAYLPTPFYSESRLATGEIQTTRGKVNLSSVIIPAQLRYHFSDQVSLALGAQANIPVGENEDVTQVSREPQSEADLLIGSKDTETETGFDLIGTLGVRIGESLSLTGNYGYVLSPIQPQDFESESRIGAGLLYRFPQK
ncbi:MAG: outer membrane beta-barrel protein [Saprospiraceae bacterium]|nr:outer membrane beta-barrel protein [Saprospiraceae bacterium]